jgi:hypothetical protein
MSDEFMEEIDRSFIEDGDPEPVHIRLAKAEHRIRELESANRLLRKQRGVAAEELEYIAKDASAGGKARIVKVVYKMDPHLTYTSLGIVEAADLMHRAAALRAGKGEQ